MHIAWATYGLVADLTPFSFIGIYMLQSSLHFDSLILDISMRKGIFRTMWFLCFEGILQLIQQSM